MYQFNAWLLFTCFSITHYIQTTKLFATGTWDHETSSSTLLSLLFHPLFKYLCVVGWFVPTSIQPTGIIWMHKMHAYHLWMCVTLFIWFIMTRSGIVLAEAEAKTRDQPTTRNLLHFMRWQCQYLVLVWPKAVTVWEIYVFILFCKSGHETSFLPSFPSYNLNDSDFAWRSVGRVGSKQKAKGVKIKTEVRLDWKWSHFKHKQWKKVKGPMESKYPKNAPTQLTMTLTLSWHI